jgi:hypothetical protein
MSFLANIKFKLFRRDTKWIPYDLEDLEISNSRVGEYPLEDDIDCIRHDGVVGIPEEVEKMTFDQYALIECEFWGEWSVDFWGEHDVEFWLDKVKFEIKNFED